jgi:hypothetical protein
MAEIGMHMGDGLTNGLIKSMGSTVDVVRSTVKKMVSAATPTFNMSMVGGPGQSTFGQRYGTSSIMNSTSNRTVNFLPGAVQAHGTGSAAEGLLGVIDEIAAAVNV